MLAGRVALGHPPFFFPEDSMSDIQEWLDECAELVTKHMVEAGELPPGAVVRFTLKCDGRDGDEDEKGGCFKCGAPAGQPCVGWEK